MLHFERFDTMDLWHLVNVGHLPGGMKLMKSYHAPGMNFESSHLCARNQHRRVLNTTARPGEVVGRSENIEVNSDAVRCP